MLARIVVAELCVALLSGVAYSMSRHSKPSLCTLNCNGYQKVVPCFAMPTKGCPVSSYKEQGQSEDSGRAKK